MTEPSAEGVRKIVEELYRSESRRVFATLVRLLGDFDRAEEALHEAFAAAVEQWPRDGVPENPRAWLVSTGRFRAIDARRAQSRFNSSLADLAHRLGTPPERPDGELEDDRLRLIFTCCHPAIASATQVALTLREVCDLSTEEIASAFLTAPSAIAQRIVRGKAKIRDAGIPYEVPVAADLPERIESVLAVVYLVFNEGYSASSGQSVTRSDLTEEAIRLGRLLVNLLPDSEVVGLLALMLFQDSRRAARSTPQGDLILLEHQDRSLWDRSKIAEAGGLVERALGSPRAGVYALQAAIAGVHAQAASTETTDWGRIVFYYDRLLGREASPVIELNRAVAVAMRDGPGAGLDLIDGILKRGELGEYHLAHAARADLCRRMGRTAEARSSYEKALALARQEPERRFLEKRLKESF